MNTLELTGITLLILAILYSVVVLLIARESDKDLEKLEKMEEERNRPITFNEYVEEKLGMGYES